MDVKKPSADKHWSTAQSAQFLFLPQSDIYGSFALGERLWLMFWNGSRNKARCNAALNLAEREQSLTENRGFPVYWDLRQMNLNVRSKDYESKDIHKRKRKKQKSK